MPSSPRISSTNVVELSGFRRTGAIRKVIQPRTSRSAELLSMRQALNYQASIEIDDLPWLQTQFSLALRDRVVRDVRQLLNDEFGRYRVARDRRMFVVRHRDVESLVAGLLRSQFHAHKVALPEHNVFDDPVDQQGVSLTWGVGTSVTEAEYERLKRRRQKYSRRQ